MHTGQVRGTTHAPVPCTDEVVTYMLLDLVIGGIMLLLSMLCAVAPLLHCVCARVCAASHKAMYPCPVSVKRLEAATGPANRAMRHVPLHAGDMFVFTEVSPPQRALHASTSDRDR